MTTEAEVDRARREQLRWVILLTLWHAEPYGCGEGILVRVAEDLPLAGATGHAIRRELAYLEGLRLVQVERAAQWHARLTPAGADVVDYRAEAPAGVARPRKYW